MLLKEHAAMFALSISYTTRKPRPGETHGVQYYFVSEEQFAAMVKENQFVEHCLVHGNNYGTAKSELKRISGLNKVCILEVDTQGAEKIHNANIGANFLFIDPPSFEILESRLKGRGTETPEQVAKRLENAKKELEFGNRSGIFPRHIVNDDVTKSYELFRKEIFGHYSTELKIKHITE